MAEADLFGWEAMRTAEAAAADAHARQAVARRKALYAPHGVKRQRQADLQAATTDALRAELQLARAEKAAAQ